MRDIEWGQAALQSEIDRYDGSYARLRDGAISIGSIVGWGALERHATEYRLVEMGVAGGRGEHEVRRLVRTGLDRGFLSPRGPSGTHDRMVDSQLIARERLAASRTAADATSWPHPADRRVLAALHDRAIHRGHVEITMSHREIVEASGVSRPTVAASLERLTGTWIRRIDGRETQQRSGVVRRVERGGSTHSGKRIASTYLMMPGPSAEIADSEPSYAHVDSALVDPGHDLWHRRGRAWEAYRYLASTTETVSARDLTEATGIPVSSSYRVLRQLAEMGLADRTDSGFRAVGRRQAAEQVDEMQLAPIAERRAIRHELERRGHDLWHADRRQREVDRVARMISAYDPGATESTEPPPPETGLDEAEARYIVTVYGNYPATATPDEQAA